MKITTTNRDLAEAIADREVARRNLRDARAAFEKAQDALFEERRELEKLRAQLEEPDDPDAVIAAIVAGGSPDLGGAKKKLASRIEGLEQSFGSWRRARDAAEAAIASREAALKRAEARVDALAATAFIDGLDVAEMIGEAQRLQEQVIDARIRLRWLASLPGDHGRQIAAYLGDPWLLAMDDSARVAAVTRCFQEKLEGLKDVVEGDPEDGSDEEQELSPAEAGEEPEGAPEAVLATELAE